MTRRALAPALAAAAAVFLFCVAPRVPDAAERIAAIVNKSVILSSDVDDQTRQAAARYNVDPADSATVVARWPGSR